MAKISKIIVAAFMAVLSLGCASAINQPVYADDSEVLPLIHLQVSPTKQKIALEPGASYVSSFKVMNIGAGEFEYQTSATPYKVTGQDYEADYNNRTTYTQIADWVTFDSKTQSGKLKPGESIDVAFTVNVPLDAPAGGQYAAIMAETSSGNAEDANIKTVNRVGMILYANVSGTTREEGAVLENTINSFMFNPPLSVTSLVENTGNVETTATYVVKMYPLFSNESVYNNEESPLELDIIPETKRFNTITWDGAPQLGVFNVEQTVTIAGQTSTNKKLVIICPLWLLFIIFAIIFFMIFWLVSRARSRRREAADITSHGERRG